MAKNCASPPILSAARRLPSASRSPNPWRRGNTLDHKSTWPQRSQIAVQCHRYPPSQSDHVQNIPLQKRSSTSGNAVQHISITQFIGSGNSLQITIPQFGPKAPMVSYSGPPYTKPAINCHFAFAADGAGITTAPGGEEFFFVGFPFEIIHSSNAPCWKLRVGNIPPTLSGSTIPGVPRCCRSQLSGFDALLLPIYCPRTVKRFRVVCK